MNYEQDPEDYDPKLSELKEFMREHRGLLQEDVSVVEATFMLHAMVGAWMTHMVDIPDKKLPLGEWLERMKQCIVIAKSGDEVLLRKLLADLFEEEQKDWRITYEFKRQKGPTRKN